MGEIININFYIMPCFRPSLTAASKIERLRMPNKSSLTTPMALLLALTSKRVHIVLGNNALAVRFFLQRHIVG